MNNSNELKRIKKAYGENFMKLCRENFPTILEQEGKLEKILNESFSKNSKTLYDDIIKENKERDFKAYVYSKTEKENASENDNVVLNKTPYELLREAGYNLYECKIKEELQEFIKWYAHGEELCTFQIPDRLDRCVVFFAVKNNAEDIKRENFKNPEREDEYGTSVMGIQFTKDELCTVSIKNRYNHKVTNPDATYGNDLNRIILKHT